MNEEFGKNINEIVGKMLKEYEEQTQGYIQEEVEKIREEFLEVLERKI